MKEGDTQPMSEASALIPVSAQHLAGQVTSLGSPFPVDGPALKAAESLKTHGGPELRKSHACGLKPDMQVSCLFSCAATDVD